MPPGNPAGYAQPQGGAPQGGGLMQAIMGMLAGSGFKDVTKGISDLAQSGVDIQSLMAMPNMPMMFAGAGLKNAANSMELIAPMMQALTPPPAPPAPKPQEMAAGMAMLSSRLGPGMTGLMPPAGPSPMMGSPGMGGPPPMPGMNQSGY